MRLRDGTEAAIRPIRPDDKDRLRAAFRGLEPASVYTRVFHAKKDLSDEELRRLTEFDPAKQAALVVTVGSGKDERIIAVGRYIASGDAAEVAFTVEEDYQRNGLAGRLLRELAEIARARGLARFEAFVLPENHAMLAVFERSGLDVKRRYEDGALRLTLELR
jgi:RimJ/RimL family protein N-acetyltransferase